MAILLRTGDQAPVSGGTPGRPEALIGDANLDGVFDSSDLVLIFQNGHYEKHQAGIATWAEGDWNGDQRFTTSDLVLAFQYSPYITDKWPN